MAKALWSYLNSSKNISSNSAHGLNLQWIGAENIKFNARINTTIEMFIVTTYYKVVWWNINFIIPQIEYFTVPLKQP